MRKIRFCPFHANRNRFGIQNIYFDERLDSVTSSMTSSSSVAVRKEQPNPWSTFLLNNLDKESYVMPDLKFTDVSSDPIAINQIANFFML